LTSDKKYNNKGTFMTKSMLRAAVATSALCVLATSVSNTVSAAQVATDPGDYSPAPAGVDLGLLYLQHASRTSVYADGKKAPIEAELTTDIGLLRWVHFMEIGGMIADPQVILPFGKVDLGKPLNGLPAMSASGVGDPIVGGTLWVMNNPNTHKSVGLTALLSLPLGDYDADQGPVNVGENRYKLITQAAYVTPLTDTMSLDVIAEYTLFGNNDDFLGFTRKQAAQYGYQTHFSYHLSDQTRLALSWFQDFGGETTVADTKQDDALNNTRWQLGVAHFFAPDKQILLQYSQDQHTESGFQEDSRLNLRLLKIF
tara:strand:- start:4141 stop:5079 length:939 start_codon:yes stop_codon:yes gene_type:complete